MTTYRIYVESSPNEFTPEDTPLFEGNTIEEVQAHVAQLRADDPLHRCRATEVVLVSGGMIVSEGNVEQDSVSLHVSSGGFVEETIAEAPIEVTSSGT